MIPHRRRFVNSLAEGYARVMAEACVLACAARRFRGIIYAIVCRDHWERYTNERHRIARMRRAGRACARTYRPRHVRGDVRERSDGRGHGEISSRALFRSRHAGRTRNARLRVLCGGVGRRNDRIPETELGRRSDGAALPRRRRGAAAVRPREVQGCARGQRSDARGSGAGEERGRERRVAGRVGA